MKKRDGVSQNALQAYIVAIAIVFVMIPISLLMFTKKATYSYVYEGVSPIDFTLCTHQVGAGEHYVCDIEFFVSDTNKYTSITGGFELSEGLIYYSANVYVPGVQQPEEDDFSNPHVTTAGGFGYNSQTFFGESITLHMVLSVAEDVAPGQELSITLKNVKLTTHDDKIENLENTTFTFNVKSDIATLDDVIIYKKVNTSVSDGTVDLTNHLEPVPFDFDTKFSSDKFNYVVNVGENESVYIKVKPTDTYATVEGSSKVSLSRCVRQDENSGCLAFPVNTCSGCIMSDDYRYTGGINDLVVGSQGNTITLTVTSPDESRNLTYTFKLVRDYDVVTDEYRYFQSDHALYVGNDTDQEIMNNLEPLPDNYSYQVSGNNLYIKDASGETYKTITLLRFTTTYKIAMTNQLYIPKGLKYSAFKTNFTSDNLTIKVEKSSNGAVVSSNSTTLTDAYYVALYYNSVVIDIYSINIIEFEISGNYITDSKTKIIKNIKDGTTFGTLKSKIITDKAITIVSNDNSTMTDSSILKTGDKISIALSSGTVTYTIAVLGDMTGDGKIDVNDVGKLYRYYRGRLPDLEEIYVVVSDITGDGGIDVNDVGKLYRYYRGKVTSLEVTE